MRDDHEDAIQNADHVALWLRETDFRAENAAFRYRQVFRSTITVLRHLLPLLGAEVSTTLVTRAIEVLREDVRYLAAREALRAEMLRQDAARRKACP